MPRRERRLEPTSDPSLLVMKPTVYIETTVISYLTARASKDQLVSGHQDVTRDWWDSHRVDFDLFTSQLVLREASVGDPDAASRRLELARALRLLAITPESVDLAEQFVRERFLPREALADATHIALATVHGMDYLLTWNCRHIANAQVRRAIEIYCADLGLQAPTVCTPEELLGE